MTRLNEELIQIIKQKISAGMNPVDVLIGIIPMSKEAAYRRLRGEIEFSMDEVIRVSRYFGISIDELRDSVNTVNRFSAQMVCVAEAPLPMERYIQSVQECIDLLKSVKTHPNPVVYVLTDILIPMFPIFKYDMLTKFFLYKWMYRCKNELYPLKMKDIVIPDDVIALHHSFIREVRSTVVHFICPPEFMLSHVQEVIFFQKMGLLEDAEVQQIKQETGQLLNEMERNMTRGRTSVDMPFSVFLSYFGFDTTYVYYHADTFGAVSVHMFGDGFYYFTDSRIVNKMKNTLDALIKNSVLISVSGEKRRLEFMARQRELVDTL